MRLTVIGCSGSYNGPDSAASSYLVEAEHDDGTATRTWRLLVDLGSGALGPLQRLTDPLGIDAVLISHRGATQDVKKIVDELERQKRHHHIHHAGDEKPG